MKYKSGEAVLKGDRVLFHDQPGEIEFIADTLGGDPAMDWYVKQYGPGAMVADPNAGRTFVTKIETTEDLRLVSRR